MRWTQRMSYVPIRPIDGSLSGERACRRFHCNFVRWRFFPYFHGQCSWCIGIAKWCSSALKQPGSSQRRQHQITHGTSTAQAMEGKLAGASQGVREGGLLFVRFVRSDSSIQKRREWPGIFVPTPLIDGKKINSPSHPRTKRNREEGHRRHHTKSHPFSYGP